jgi:hypothetical protein
MSIGADRNGAYATSSYWWGSDTISRPLWAPSTTIPAVSPSLSFQGPYEMQRFHKSWVSALCGSIPYAHPELCRGQGQALRSDGRDLSERLA